MHPRRRMDPNGIPAILMSAGGLYGIAATAWFYRFFIALVAATSFGLVALLGYLVFRSPRGSRPLSTRFLLPASVSW